MVRSIKKQCRRENCNSDSTDCSCCFHNYRTLALIWPASSGARSFHYTHSLAVHHSIVDCGLLFRREYYTRATSNKQHSHLPAWTPLPRTRSTQCTPTLPPPRFTQAARTAAHPSRPRTSQPPFPTSRGPRQSSSSSLPCSSLSSPSTGTRRLIYLVQNGLYPSLANLQVSWMPFILSLHHLHRMPAF